MMKIKELFNFEDIEQVIEINKNYNEQEMVEKFVISPNLKEDLIEFLDYLKDNKPDKNTSINVIGNYGTGKSHLLSFLSIILSNSKMIKFIQDEELKKEFSNLNREFFVVKFELPGQEKTFEDVFFYRVRKQLKNNYNIDIRKMGGSNDPKDPKELIEEILIKIKEKYPTKGLIVICDEYSDFIKSKESFKQNMDLQFTRQIAECSKNQDFILMLSMQEHIFSNPVYKDKADLINKIEKRFLKINITSENVEDIIAKRMVTKNSNQIQEIKNLFKSFNLAEKFPNLALEEDRYIKLFPVHPYLIEMISNLTLFENRSILKFISQKTKEIQEKEFPTFITYDLIYDSLIESEHTIRNNEIVKPIIPIVNSLKDIVPRLPEQYRNQAHRLIKALAIKNLVTPPNSKGDRKGGDTAEKFAENLCIIPESNFMEPADDIETILNMLITHSEGQFITKDKESDTYFINLNKTTDYEQLINNKAENMDDLGHNNEVFVEEFLLNELDFHDSINDMIYAEPNKKYVLEDTVKWNQRNSFKEGILTINIGNNLLIKDTKDFLITLRGFGPVKINENSSNHIIIKPKYTDEFKQSIRRLAAVNQFLKTKTHTEAMRRKKNKIIDEELKTSFKKCLGQSNILYDSNEYSLEDLGISNGITSEIFSQIKENLLGENLVNKYPHYPKFKSNAILSKNNIENTMDSVIKELSIKSRLSDFDLKSSRILTPLSFLKDNVLDVNNSYASLILDEIENTDKNIDINDIVEKFEDKPYGIQKEITYLIIAVLLRNGNLMISNKNGKSYSSAEFSELFKPGIKAFKDLKYIKKEEGPGPNTQELFDLLDLDKSLLELKKNHSLALQTYIEKYDLLSREIKGIYADFDNIKFRNIGLPLEDIESKIQIIKDANFEKLEVSTLSGFNKLEYSKEKIEEAYKIIKLLKDFFNDYESFIYDGIRYMKDTLKFIDNDFFKVTDKEELNKIYNESLDIVSNSRKLLKPDERRPIEGKIQQFKDKYKSIYYNMHENYVGSKVNWDGIDNLEQSNDLKKLTSLRNIKFINPRELRDIQVEIRNIKDLKCNSLIADDLNNNYHCSCMFPNNMSNHKNINEEIDDLIINTENLLKSWENEILDVIKDNKNKLNQLESNHKNIIEDILNSNKIPKAIDLEFINAVNNLLDDIEIKDVSINELYEIITTESDTFKVDEILDKVEKYLKKDLNNLSKARIRLIKDKWD